MDGSHGHLGRTHTCLSIPLLSGIVSQFNKHEIIYGVTAQRNLSQRRTVTFHPTAPKEGIQNKIFVGAVCSLSVIRDIQLLGVVRFVFIIGCIITRLFQKLLSAFYMQSSLYFNNVKIMLNPDKNKLNIILW